MVIYVYEGDNRTLVGVLSEYESVCINQYYNEVGTIRLRILDGQNSSNPWILPDTWLWPQGCSEIFIVETVERTYNGLYTQTDIRGSTATNLLKRRCVTLDAFQMSTSGQLMSYLLNYEFGTNARRPFPGLTMNVNTGLGQSVLFQTAPDTLLYVVDTLCNNDNIGYATYFNPDSKSMAFTTYTGQDYSVTNGYLPVLIDPEYEYVQETTYKEDIHLMANYGYAYGEMNTAVNPPVQKKTTYDASGGASGYQLFEYVVRFDKRSKTEQYILTDQQYLQSMQDYTRQLLMKRRRVIQTRGVLLGDSEQYVLGEDYNLGDTVTFRDKKHDTQYDGMVKEIERSIERGIMTTRISIAR
ncbi:hypothetical protein AGMMS49992_16810 [Clostridia bacterium]|nr:hypothetical protein AGMMS49992_16810 [Clostridia bacterium]